MTQLISATIEEFEQGAWVADIVSLDTFGGSFTIGDVTWKGTAVSSRVDDKLRNVSRVVGGGGGLAKVLEYRYYDGSVTLQAALQDICRLSGETFGGAEATIQLSTYQRLKGAAYTALDALASTQNMIWWIDRDGETNIQAARPTGGDATGVRTESDQFSVLLSDPIAELGQTFDDKPIRHIRWEYTSRDVKARLYALPFIFRPPEETAYDCMYNAAVNKDNGDGTIDVIADGKFGVTKVPLFCGVPGSKVKVNGGEQVMLGFFGGDPRKPFAVAMAQNINATKEVARNSDPVKVSIPAGSFLISCSGSPAVGVLNPVAVDVTGTITQGSARLKVGDA